MELEGLEVAEELNARFIVARLCARLPGLDWSLDEAALVTDRGVQSMVMFAAVRFEERAGTLWRCDRAFFPWPGRAVPRVRVLEVRVMRLVQDPAEVPDCAAVNARLRWLGIRVEPVQGEGMGGCRVVEKPAGMSEAEAYRRLQEALSPTLPGPWTFSLGEGVWLP